MLQVLILHFNSHAHVERDFGVQVSLICMNYFNSHAHVERDAINWFHRKNIQISTHTLTWSVTFQKFFVSKLNMTFQLTRSRGAWRHKCIYPYWQIFKFQLTRSRGAWHSCKNTLSAFPISTHTLTWSVTLLVISLIGITGFQLTRSRGAWLKCFLILWISSAFQLTRSRGAWHARSGSISIKTAISTHTLTWSVT